jgi:hypothetical protein
MWMANPFLQATLSFALVRCLIKTYRRDHHWAAVVLLEHTGSRMELGNTYVLQLRYRQNPLDTPELTSFLYRCLVI